MKAIIMAGGEGTRLRPLTCSIPKPLAKLCGRPVVHYILDLLNEHGCSEAVFTLGYKAGQIEEAFESGRYKNINLRFSREESPLGTAGCVKNAVSGEPPEDLLVISGDALCDFDLTAALEHHRTTGASATIITKKVDDPREFGLVITDPATGAVTGFSEKHSYLGCISDAANTGVYILSPEVMGLIPDGKQVDFARDVFPQMLNAGMTLFAFEEQGYWCDIGDFATYVRSQHDLLYGQVKYPIAPERIRGNNYVGENVTIGANTSIDSCIIGDNVSVGNNVKLHGAVILDSAFISDGATVNRAIICNGAKLQHSASVYEGCVIGENCIIGREAIVSGGSKVWNGKHIAPGSNVTRDVKHASFKSAMISAAELSDAGLAGETNVDITPEFCARLGASLATVASGRSVAISCENNNASRAMKLSIMAGAMSAGAEVFDVGTAVRPQLIYAAGLLDCGVIARVKCGVLAQVEVFASHGLHLSRIDERRLEAGLTRSEFKNADWSGFGGIHAFGGFADVYASMLRNHTNFKSKYRIKINCNNPALCQTLAPAFARVASNDPKSEILVVTLTEGGSQAEIFTENDTKIEYDKLVLLAAASQMSQGFDVALPNDFSASADYLAQGYGRKVHRYFLCPNDSGDENARKLAAGQMFLRDGAVLALNVLEHLSRNALTIEGAVKTIPQFASTRREVEINCPPQRIISKLCGLGSGKGEGVLIGNPRESVLIRSAKRGNALYLYAESLSSETAEELCVNAENLVKKLNNENKKSNI